MHRNYLFAVLAVTLLSTLVEAGVRIDHAVFSSSGGTSSGVTTTVRNTLGESLAVDAVGVHHHIRGGFWPAAVPTIALDFDQNGIVDLRDFAAFSACVTGPNGGPIDPHCAPGDADHDDDIDLRDFAQLQISFSSP